MSDRIKGLYEGDLAASYERDRTTEAKWHREDEIVRALLVALAPKTVLDVPVGTGRFLAVYRELGIGATGVDASSDMLAVARTAGHDVPLRVGDITSLAFAAKQFDVTVCIRFCNLVPFDTVQLALRELSRVSRDHVIVGIRLRRPLREHFREEPSRAVLIALRRIKLAATGLVRTRKMQPQHEQAVLREMEAAGLSVVERRGVNVGLDGSRYDIFLLACRTGHERTLT